MSREAAYEAVQKNAAAVWDGRGTFLDNLKGDAAVTGHLDGAALAELFDLGYHTKHVDTIFQRVFGGD
jgi:adenylosuccinate lyase